jgi:hypothetical protein
LARRRATAAPIPRELPVTMAVLVVSLDMMCSSVGDPVVARLSKRFCYHSSNELL